MLLQAAKELEAAETVRKKARKEAAKKSAAEEEVKKESEDSRPSRQNPNPKSPKAGDMPKPDSGKGSKEGIKDAAGDEDEDDCTPRDSEGNELAVDIDTSKLTAAQLQEELTKRGLDVKWQPLKGKKVLVDRLQVTLQTSPSCLTLVRNDSIWNARAVIKAMVPHHILQECWSAATVRQLGMLVVCLLLHCLYDTAVNLTCHQPISHEEASQCMSTSSIRPAGLQQASVSLVLSSATCNACRSTIDKLPSPAELLPTYHVARLTGWACLSWHLVVQSISVSCQRTSRGLSV